MEFQILDSSNGQFYSRFVAGNGRVIFTTETYVDKADARAAAQLVKDNAWSAPIVDKTRTAATRR